MATHAGKSASDTPFSDTMRQAKDAAEDYTRMFAEMKWHAVPDKEGLLAAHRRNMETFSAANRIALEGAQAVAARHMEIMQQTMAELTETMHALATPGETPQARTAKQAELIKRTYERAVANTREISELIQRANGEALELLNKRFTEAMDEVKALVEKATTQKP